MWAKPLSLLLAPFGGAFRPAKSPVHRTGGTKVILYTLVLSPSFSLPVRDVPKDILKRRIDLRPIMELSGSIPLLGDMHHGDSP